MAPTTPADGCQATGAVLITGATGFVGMEILARYLAHTDRPVYAAVRGRDRAEAEARLRTPCECMFGSEDGFADRLRAVPADIERPAARAVPLPA